MAGPSHPSRLDYSNYTWRRVAIGVNWNSVRKWSFWQPKLLLICCCSTKEHREWHFMYQHSLFVGLLSTFLHACARALQTCSTLKHLKVLSLTKQLKLRPIENICYKQLFIFLGRCRWLLGQNFKWVLKVPSETIQSFLILTPCKFKSLENVIKLTWKYIGLLDMSQFSSHRWLAHCGAVPLTKQYIARQKIANKQQFFKWVLKSAVCISKLN
jgi:hypothetical protein